MESPAALLAGADFGARYRIVRCLKHGGMGSVYEVLDRRTDRLRALKVMQPEIATDADMRARFEKEASIVGRVRSDHIVEVVDAGIAEPDTPFLVMELLAGRDLESVIVDEGALPAQAVVTMLAQVALGLDKVHAEGVIHRDLKPQNLFMTTRDDGAHHVKILDFGVAKVLHHDGGLSTTRSLGTPLYMAPEQLTGDGAIGREADLYALTHVAFCLLTGKPYWQEEARRASNAYSFMNVVVRGPVEQAGVRAARLGVTLPASFDRWFAKGTASRPERRFGSAVEQIAALRSALSVGNDAAAPPVPSTAERSSPVPWIAVAVAVAVGVAVALAVGLWVRSRSTHAEEVAPTPAVAAEVPATAHDDRRDGTSVRTDASVEPPRSPPAPPSGSPPASASSQLETRTPTRAAPSTKGSATAPASTAGDPLDEY